LKIPNNYEANINESIKEEENLQQLYRIQKSFVGGPKQPIVVDNRKFIREGPVMKLCRKTDKARSLFDSISKIFDLFCFIIFFSLKRWFFLFSDVLVYASIATSRLSKTNSIAVSGRRSRTMTMNQLKV
jgi:hypothetical protein